MTVFSLCKHKNVGAGGQQEQGLTLKSPEVRLSVVAFSVIFLYFISNFLYVIALLNDTYFNEIYSVVMLFVDMLNVCNVWFLLMFSTAVRNTFVEFVTCGKIVPGHAIVHPIGNF